MTRITEQNSATIHPVLKRLAIKQGPAIIGVGLLDEVGDNRMPAFEVSQYLLFGALLRPRLRSPSIIFDNANKVSERPAAQSIGHRVTPFADPDTSGGRRCEITKPFPRHDGAPCSMAGEVWTFRSEHLRADRRVDSICADQ